jgi:hypothetical protein
VSTSRDARLQWARQRAAGQLTELTWVDRRLAQDTEPFTHTDAGFHGQSVTSPIPEVVLAAARAAHRRGEPTLLEGLQLVMGEHEWLVESRAMLWSADSPEPRLLAALVESLGLDASLHRHDPTRLQRLVARLRPWNARRGEARPAIDLLSAALGEHPLERLHATDQLRNEVFACRSARWWAARGAQQADVQLRISGGWTRFQPARGTAVQLRAEDILVDWTPGSPVHRGLLRLLPVWTCYRVAVASETRP